MAWPNPTSPRSPSTSPELTPAAIVALVSGTLMVLASALAWVTIDALELSYSAWTTDFGFFPVSTFVPLAGLVTAALVGARMLLGDRLPGDPTVFVHAQLALAVAALLLALGYLFMEREGADLGAGYWINLLGAMGLVAAAVLELLSRRSTRRGPTGGGFSAPPGSGPPGTPTYDAQPPAGQPMPPPGPLHPPPPGPYPNPGSYPNPGPPPPPPGSWPQQ